MTLRPEPPVIEPTGIELIPSEATLTDYTETFELKITPSEFDPLSNPEWSVEYTVDKEGIVHLEPIPFDDKWYPGGVRVTPLEAGEVTITVTSSNGLTNQSHVTVDKGSFALTYDKDPITPTNIVELNEGEELELFIVDLSTGQLLGEGWDVHFSTWDDFEIEVETIYPYDSLSDGTEAEYYGVRIRALAGWGNASIRANITTPDDKTYLVDFDVSIGGA